MNIEKAKKMMELCDAKSSCVVDVSNAVFGEPCKAIRTSMVGLTLSAELRWILLILILWLTNRPSASLGFSYWIAR